MIQIELRRTCRVVRVRVIEADYFQAHSLRPLFRISELFGRDEIAARTVLAACVNQFVKSRDMPDIPFRRPEQKPAAFVGILPPGMHPYALNEVSGKYQHDILFLPKEFVEVLRSVVRENRDHHPIFKPFCDPDGGDRCRA